MQVNKSSTESKVLSTAYELFLRQGYKNTTMDEIALSLGMSKKTLYKFHPGKKELLEASFEMFKTKMTSKIEALSDNPYIPYPLKLKSTMTTVSGYMAPISPEFFEDLRELVPEAWEDLRNYINESAYVRFHKLLSQGVEEGFIDPKMNIGMVVIMYAAAVQSLLDPKFVNQFPEVLRKEIAMSPSEIYDQAVSIIYMGILTEEARVEFANG